MVVELSSGADNERIGRPVGAHDKEHETQMGVPKRRVSHARQGERRAHLAIELPNLEECSHCHEMKLPHHVCPNCGYYNGRLAVQLKPETRPDDAAR